MAVDKRMKTLARWQQQSAPLLRHKDPSWTDWRITRESTMQLNESSTCCHVEGCVQFYPFHPTDVTETVKSQGQLQRQEVFSRLENLSCREVWKRPAAILCASCPVRSIPRSIGCRALSPEWAPALRYMWTWARANNRRGSSLRKRLHWSFPVQADPAGRAPERQGHNASTSNNKWKGKGAGRINKTFFN